MNRALVAIVCALTSACSGVKIAYSLADDMVESWVDERLDLDDATEALAEQEIAAFFRWHRRVMLPRYADFLRREADIHARGEFSRATFDVSARTVEHLWQDTARGAFTGVAAVLERQTPKQITYMRGRMAERDTELRGQYSRRLEEIRNEGEERVVEGFEIFIGDLSDTQLRLIDGHARALELDPEYWLRNRRRRNQALVGFLANRPTKADIVEFLEDWLLAPHIYAEAGYQEFADGVRHAVEDMIFDVLAAMTPEQHLSFLDTLRSCADDLSDLVT